MKHEDYVSDIGVDALLFQTGYLTIVGEEHRGPWTLYRLDYPNFEVQQSLNQGLLEYVTCRDREAVDHGEALVRLLGEHDFDGFAERFRSFLAGVPYPWHDSGKLDRYESWYTSMLYMSFRTIGVDLRVEETSHRGGSDLVVLHQGQVFVQECKMAQDARETEAMRDRAVEQMGERGTGCRTGRGANRCIWSVWCSVEPSAPCWGFEPSGTEVVFGLMLWRFSC